MKCGILYSPVLGSLSASFCIVPDVFIDEFHAMFAM